jgi:hypothetical protein
MEKKSAREKIIAGSEKKTLFHFAGFATPEI